MHQGAGLQNYRKFCTEGGDAASAFAPALTLLQALFSGSNRSPQRREGLKDTQKVLSKGYNLCEPWRSLRLCSS